MVVTASGGTGRERASGARCGGWWDGVGGWGMGWDGTNTHVKERGRRRGRDVANCRDAGSTRAGDERGISGSSRATWSITASYSHGMSHLAH